MNWKNTVSKLNAKHYAFPAGWDTRDAVAEQLDCSPDRVDSLLTPGLKSGEIEKAQFPVWEPRLNRKVMVVGYRQRPAEAESVKPVAPSERNEIIAAHKRHPHLTAARLRDYLRKELKGKYTKEKIAEIIKAA